MSHCEEERNDDVAIQWIRLSYVVLLVLLSLQIPANARSRNLARRGITDISSFKFKEGLTRIKLNRNEITEIAPLQLPSTLRRLDIPLNQITDLNQLQLNNNLEVLSAFSNQITTVNGLVLNPKLKTLVLGINPLTDPYLLDLPDSLRELDLLSCDLDDSSVNGLILSTNLDTLQLSFNSLTTLSGIDFGAHIKNLSLSSNFFQEFEWDLLPSSIEDLNLIGNEFITNFDEMVLPSNLKELNLDVIFFDSFLFLNGKLPDSLEVLTLDRCFVGTVEGLELPPKLAKLELTHNNLTSFDLDLPETMRDLDLRKNNFSREEKARIRAKYADISGLKIRL